MKKKSASKAIPKKDSRVPVTNAIASQDEEIPPGLEMLAQLKDLSPVQQIAMAIPKFSEVLKTEKATEATEAFAGLFWGVGMDLGVPLPEWVKTASEKGWQGFGLGFIRDVKDGQPAAIGKFVELMNLSPKTDNPSVLEQTASNLVKFIKTESGDMPAEELKQYADGRTSAPKIIEKAKNPSERTMAFIAIAGAWREIEKLGSRTKTYKWLKENKLISPFTEWDEVRRWLDEINLPKGKAGAPRKIGAATK